MDDGKRHWSDCAVHNEPELDAGPCDCGGYTPGQKPPASPASIILERRLDELLKRGAYRETPHD